MGSLSSSSSGSSSGKGLCYRVSGILVGTLDEFYKYEDKVKQSGDTRVKVYVYETEMNGFGLVNLLVYHKLLKVYFPNGNWVVFEWDTNGFNIVYEHAAYTYSKYIGETSLRNLFEACKRYSKAKYNLATNNCRHWANDVASSI